MKQPFVISRDNRLGIGKLVSRDGDTGVVEYFRSPTESEPFHLNVPFANLRKYTLFSQTRVYFQDQINFSWQIGRVLDYHSDEGVYLIGLPNDDRRLIPSDLLKVRCKLPIDDPTDHLAYQINETAFWHPLRSEFVKHLLEQKQANLGLTALVSSSIELVAHQMAVVQRVLLDPFQRYLLADEVGLGKTIEAGVLIKQFSLDQPFDHDTLIIVPETLLLQWKQELTHRFHLGSKIGESIHIVSARDQSQIRRFCSKAKMIVIDEAHHLCSWAWSSETTERDTFEIVRIAVGDLGRKLLLLSATPVLHNEKSFLAMLHLLDPQVYALDRLEEFKDRVQKRQEIAESMLSLTETESNYFIADALEELGNLLESDREFQNLRGQLADLIDLGVAEDDASRNQLIRSIRTHVSDVWQLHRRILRNRRTDRTGVYLPGRGGAKRIEYHCDAELGLCDAIDAWRLTLSSSLFSASDVEARCLKESVKTAEELAATDPRELVAWASKRLNDFDDMAEQVFCETERHHLNQIVRAAKECDLVAKMRQLLSLIESAEDDIPFVVFANSKITADQVFKFLEPRFKKGRILRHSMENDDWRSFRFSDSALVLICDRDAEEGLNLQRRGAVAVHFDLPFSPNRIEQRMGRLDRFGQGNPVQTTVLVSAVSKVQQKWFELVCNSLAIFDRSIATLQYVVEDELSRLWDEFLDSGSDAIEHARERLGGEEGRIYTELKRIRAQDELDSFEPDLITQQIADNLESKDFQLSRESPAIFSKWLRDGLKFQSTGEESREDDIFSYRFCRRIDNRSFPGNHDTLVPLDEFQSRFKHSVENLPCEPPTRLATVPFTFDRVVAQRRSTRLLRVGDPWVDSFDDYTRWDDHGVCFAFWRHCPRYKSVDGPEVYFRVDYVISPDTKPLEELCSLRPGASLNSMIRRSMAIMKPSFKTIWLSSNLEIVNPKPGGLLGLPFTKADHEWGRDYNLNSSRWNIAARYYDMSIWRDLCFAIRRKSEELLRTQIDLLSLCETCVSLARESSNRIDQQFRSRMSMANEELLDSLRREQQFEMAFLDTQILSFRSPVVRVDSIGSVFLSRENPFSDEDRNRSRREVE
jgi:ATP-dependent helicase HepA